MVESNQLVVRRVVGGFAVCARCLQLCHRWSCRSISLGTGNCGIWWMGSRTWCHRRLRSGNRNFRIAWGRIANWETLQCRAGGPSPVEEMATCSVDISMGVFGCLRWCS
jgi:hypothetical protein